MARQPARATGAAEVEVDTQGLPEGQPVPSENAPQEGAVEERREAAEEFVPPFETIVPETQDEEPEEINGPAVVLVGSYGSYETEHGTFTLGEPQEVASEDVVNELVALRGPHGEELFRAV